MATITREELPELVREELLRLLKDAPAVRYQLVGMMVETFAQRTDLQAILERIDAQRADFNQRMEGFAKRQEEHSRRMEEFAKRQEEHSRRLEEHSRRMDEMRKDFNLRFAEHSQRMDEMREDFNRGFAQFSKEIRDVDLHVQAMGARWGILAEDAFRAGIAGILTEGTGLKVERYLKMDTEGQVFGQPDQVEIDVVIHNGDCWLLELKSSISQGDVSLFRRKVAFYAREEQVEVKRSIIISPYFDAGAEKLARDLGIETYTSAREVRV